MWGTCHTWSVAICDGNQDMGQVQALLLHFTITLSVNHFVLSSGSFWGLVVLLLEHLSLNSNSPST